MPKLSVVIQKEGYHANRTTNSMFCPTSETEAEVDAVKLITDHSMAVALLWFSVACFGGIVSVMFHLMYVQIILVRFRLLSGHVLGKSCSKFEHI